MNRFFSRRSPRVFYSGVLITLLLLEFLYHNPVPWREPSLELAVYPMPFPTPFLLHLGPLLGVVGAVLWHTRRADGPMSVRAGLGAVEPVVRYTGFGVGAFAVGYGFLALAGFNSVLSGAWRAVLLWGSFAALATWLLGLLFALVGAILLVTAEAVWPLAASRWGRECAARPQRQGRPGESHENGAYAYTCSSA